MINRPTQILPAQDRVDILTKRVANLKGGAGVYTDKNRGLAIYDAEQALSEAQDDLDAASAE